MRRAAKKRKLEPDSGEEQPEGEEDEDRVWKDDESDNELEKMRGILVAGAAAGGKAKAGEKVRGAAKGKLNVGRRLPK